MLYVDVNYVPICLIMCLSQDEVAHTVTESRVLQNTRHPFLTVRTLIMTSAPCQQTQPHWNIVSVSCRSFPHEYSISGAVI